MSEGWANLSSLDLAHLLIFFLILLDWLVEEEVGSAHTDAVTRRTVDGQNLFELLKCAVRGLAPSL